MRSGGVKPAFGTRSPSGMTARRWMRFTTDRFGLHRGRPVNRIFKTGQRLVKMGPVRQSLRPRMAQSSREIYWSPILANFRRSGTDPLEFCRLRHISIRSFHDWLYRL